MAKFKLIQKPTFKAPVMILRAGYNAEKVELEFQYLDRTALVDLYTAWNERHDELSRQVGDMFTAAQIDLQSAQCNQGEFRCEHGASLPAVHRQAVFFVSFRKIPTCFDWGFS